jgi:hypothetical protein
MPSRSTAFVLALAMAAIALLVAWAANALRRRGVASVA